MKTNGKNNRSKSEKKLKLESGQTEDHKQEIKEQLCPKIFNFFFSYSLFHGERFILGSFLFLTYLNMVLFICTSNMKLRNYTYS